MMIIMLCCCCCWPHTVLTLCLLLFILQYTGLVQACTLIAREEGVLALWKGITPRLMRIVPGQAITFMTYEFVSSNLIRMGVF